ncbi:MAG: pyridoxal-5-phosphate-dependent protein subunit beta, partial [Bacteroidota bacterium]
KNTNMVTVIDDEDCMRILRLFNEKEGKDYLTSSGVDKEFVRQLSILGISGISNILSAIKTAKYYELSSDDILFAPATDSADMYKSRIEELSEEHGEYNQLQAAKDLEKCLFGTRTDNMKELTYTDQKAIHNLKYFTWIEQQGKDVEDLNQLWYDRDIWHKMFSQVDKWDELINEFNEMTGLK